MRRTPLDALHEARGAHWMEHAGWRVPAYYSSIAEEYQALQEGVGLIDLSFRGKIRVSGRDRRTWLHGQVTQDVNGLPDWRGSYATILDPRGHMVSDARIFALPDALLVDFPAGTPAPMAEYLERFLIMERAEIEDLTDSWAVLSLQGPLSEPALAAVLGDEAKGLPMWGIVPDSFRDETLYISRVTHCGEDGFDLFVSARCAPALWGELCAYRPEFAVHSVGWDALNLRRIEAGIPAWGAELDPSLVPLEARLENAISYTKGCYVGQEIIARIHARGHVNNLLTGFFIHGDILPVPGSELQHDGRKVGRISTSIRSPRLERPIALGFLRRELQEPGTRLDCVTESGTVGVEVTNLPFIPHDYPGAAVAGPGTAPTTASV